MIRYINLICAGIRDRNQDYKFTKKIFEKGLCLHDTHTVGRGGASGEFGYTGGSNKKNSFQREVSRICLLAHPWKVSLSIIFGAKRIICAGRHRFCQAPVGD